jgi:hypothetical protein
VGAPGGVVYGPAVAAAEPRPEVELFATRLKVPDVGYNVLPTSPVRLYEVAGAVIVIGEPGTPVPESVYDDIVPEGGVHEKLIEEKVATVPENKVGLSGLVYPLVDVDPPLPDEFLDVIVNVKGELVESPEIVVDEPTPIETNFEIPSTYVIS